LQNRPVPLGKRVLCRVIRKKNIFQGNVYEMYLEGLPPKNDFDYQFKIHLLFVVVVQLGRDGKRFFLLNAKAEMNQIFTIFLISSSKGEFLKSSKSFRGTVKSNFKGCTFSAHTSGKSKEKYPTAPIEELKKEILAATFVTLS